LERLGRESVHPTPRSVDDCLFASLALVLSRGYRVLILRCSAQLPSRSTAAAMVCFCSSLLLSALSFVLGTTQCVSASGMLCECFHLVWVSLWLVTDVNETISPGFLCLTIFWGSTSPAIFQHDRNQLLIHLFCLLRICCMLISVC
jgi:hypothetical protein